MKDQRHDARHLFNLILALAGLVIGIALPLASANFVASAKQSASGSISFAHAQETPLGLNRWSSNGPDGGPVSSLAIARSNPATIYAGAGGRVFKSTNSGESWGQPLSSDHDHSVSNLAIDPVTSTTVYAAGNGVSKSTDGGASWHTINNGLTNQFGNAFISALAIDPSTPTTLYAGGTIADNHFGISKTTDGGTSWHTINNGLPIDEWGDALKVSALAIDSSNPNIIYAAGGVSIPNTFASFPTVYKSTDGGSSWSRVFNGFRVASFLVALAIDPINSNTIYTGGYAYDCCGGVVLKSTNGGASWTQSNLSSPVSTLAIDPANSSIIYAGGSGVFKSANNGASWSASNNGLPTFGVGALAIDPVNPSIVYAGTGDGIFKSADRGVGWSAANKGLRAVNASKIAVNPGSPNTIFTETYNGVYKSADNGESWAPSDFYPLAFDHGNPNVIYANLSGHLSKSTSAGATWSSANTGLETNDVRTLVIDPNDSQVFYAGTGGSLYKSTNGAESWSAIGNLLCPELLAIDPGNSQTLYAVASYACDDYCTTVYKSTDGGLNWVRSDTGTSFYYVSVLAIDSFNAQTIYVSAGGLAKSTDGGGSWNAVISQPGTSGVSSVVVDPVRPNVLYAGTYGEGVFMSPDGGTNWNSLNDGLTDFNINALAIDSTGNLLHAGTQTGVFDYQFSCAYSTSLTSQSLPAGGASGSVAVTATSGCTWQAGSTVSWITINSPNSGIGDGTVNFLVAANAGPFPRTATLNIAGQTFTVNQFGAPPINAADDTDFFVRQHYIDFLNRQADPTGLDFWTNNITSCGFDTHCFEVKRIDTSAAFFLSIEFQNTGYLVYRIYKASYGNLPGAPVPIKLDEFLPDTQQISQGVIVNQSGWEQVLENNKQAFASEFVQRSRFTLAFPASLTPALFVDRLFANAGVTPSDSDRTAAVDEFGSAITTGDVVARARALRRVGENSTLAQQEFNRAFVLMQYFGYLRRDPNDPPELTLDFQGYNFWLNKLNEFNGNFVDAEMVKAFIVSSEYRQRFGQP
jgi:photosystem II stability/assembly factor-like uncharacterized protein